MDAFCDLCLVFVSKPDVRKWRFELRFKLSKVFVKWAASVQRGAALAMNFIRVPSLAPPFF